jgi:hypothetical protein
MKGYANPNDHIEHRTTNNISKYGTNYKIIEQHKLKIDSIHKDPNYSVTGKTTTYTTGAKNSVKQNLRANISCIYPILLMLSTCCYLLVPLLFRF